MRSSIPHIFKSKVIKIGWQTERGKIGCGGGATPGLAAEAMEAGRRASLLSCRGSSSPKFPGSHPQPASSRNPGWKGATARPPNSAPGPQKVVPSNFGGNLTGASRRTDIATVLQLSTGVQPPVTQKEGCAPLAPRTPDSPHTANPQLCIYKEPSEGRSAAGKRPCG